MFWILPCTAWKKSAVGRLDITVVVGWNSNSINDLDLTLHWLGQLCICRILVVGRRGSEHFFQYFTQIKQGMGAPYSLNIYQTLVLGPAMFYIARIVWNYKNILDFGARPQTHHTTDKKNYSICLFLYPCFCSMRQGNLRETVTKNIIKIYRKCVSSVLVLIF